MKITIASDVHLEFGMLNLVNPGADVLVLAGDIMIAQDLHDHTPESIAKTLSQTTKLGSRQLAAQKFRNFLKQASEQFRHVIYVAGNHEFYHGKWHASLNHIRHECEQWTNVTFLENETCTIDDVVFVGATLWTDMNNNDWHTKYHIKHAMSDFRVIKNDQNGFHSITPDDVIMRHRESLEFIKSAVAATVDKKVVVVTHHAPSDQSVAVCYQDDTLMNGGYRSNLEDFILDSNIALWLHGHTHHDFDYMMGNTRVVCNPRGYIGHEARANNFSLKVLEL